MAKVNGYPESVRPGIPVLSKTPSGWERAPLEKYLKEVRRPAKLADEVLYQLVTVKRARGGVVEREHLLGKEIKTKSQFFVKHGDFLISKRQIVHGACGLVPDFLDGAIVSNEYAVLADKGGVDLEFLRYLSESIYFQQTCFHSSIGVHLEKMIFKVDRWLKWPFNLPSLGEQKKISRLLDTWARAIEVVEKLIENSKAQKKALLQQLLTGKVRVRGHSGQWTPYEFSNIAKLSNKKFDPQRSQKSFVCVELEHLSQTTGELLDSIDSAAQQSAKNVFNPGDVLFGKLRPYLKKYWLSDITGICSTEIWVLQPNVSLCLPEYLYYLVQTERFIASCHVTSGSKMPRADWEYVSSTPFALPPIKEQRDIIKILQLSTREITCLQENLKKLRNEKLALMQKLLTGKRRVKVDES